MVVSKLDLKIGFDCNNFCDFCIQGNKRKIYSNRDFKILYLEMKKSRSLGVVDICITGGEPTLHADIVKVVLSAKKLGFKNIQIQSNGSRFGEKAFFLQLLKAGVTEFSPSLHGSNAKIHDDLVHRKGAFQQCVAGIELIHKFKQKILTNTVITSKNYKDLPNIAKLLSKYNISQMQFAFVHIGGTAFKNREWLVPKKTLVMPYVKKALDFVRKKNILGMVEAIPYCLMSGYEDCISEDFMPDTRVFDSNGVLVSYKKYKTEGEKGKKKRMECLKCKYNKICEGPWNEYPEMFGWDEFQSIKK